MNQIKYTLSIFLLLATLNLYAQNDTIINYLDYRGSKTNDISELFYLETITKNGDSLWITKRFNVKGKLFAYWYTKTSDYNNKIGQSITLDSNDSISSLEFYNQKSLKHGQSKGWFNNRKLNWEGRYVDGKREGAWQYYHYNGKLALKGFFKNDSLIRAYHFDENGVKINKPETFERNAFFDKGMREFQKNIKKIPQNLKDIIRGKVIFIFTIQTDGSIQDVMFSRISLSEDLENQLIHFLKSIKGWQPAIHLGRKIPLKMKIPITFL